MHCKTNDIRIVWIELRFSVPPLLVFLGRPEKTHKKHEFHHQNNHPPPKRHDNRDEGIFPSKIQHVEKEQANLGWLGTHTHTPEKNEGARNLVALGGLSNSTQALERP